MTIDNILHNYAGKFHDKTFEDVFETSDVLMDVFGIDPTEKRLNMQYWSRELGMCWQKLVQEVSKTHRAYGPPIRWGADEPCDLVISKTAIDTKYRLGSGDSGPLKKLKEYAQRLSAEGYTPVMLILRTDNLDSAVDACVAGGWRVYTGNDAFKFIERRTSVNLHELLGSKKHTHALNILDAHLEQQQHSDALLQSVGASDLDSTH